MASMTPSQNTEWQQHGFLKVPGLLNRNETHDLDLWVAEIASWPATNDRWMHHYEQTESGVRLARSEYLLAFHDGLRRLVTAGRIPETAGELLGHPVVLYKEKINYKCPGGGGYAPHQDAPAYRYVKHHITCAIAIDAATPENGCLSFASGLHRNGLLPLDERGCLPASLANQMTWTDVSMEPGDALFFSSYTPHKSAPNRSSQPRRNLYLTYNAASAGDLREAYYDDKRRTLAATKPNEEGAVPISKIGHFQGKSVRP